MYSSTLSLTSALDEGGWSTPRPDHFIPGKTRYSLYGKGRDSSVGIETRYGLDGPGTESRRGGETYRTCPDRSWGPPSLLLYNGYWVFPGGKAAGAWR